MPVSLWLGRSVLELSWVIRDSPAFFDGKHARAIDAISAPAPHAMVRAVLDS